MAIALVDRTNPSAPPGDERPPRPSRGVRLPPPPTPGDAARLAEIALVLARNGVITAARDGGSIVVRPLDRGPRSLARALRKSFVDLGPTFVKLGQLVASSPGLFPEVLSDELRGLLDDVPPEPPRRIRTVVEQDLGAPLGVLFTSFDERPVASASIAQVHRATLLDGTQVAVKVRRPRLRGRIERDLRLLHYVAFVLARSGAVGTALNPVAIVEDLAETLRAELDLRQEAEAMVEIRSALAASGAHDRIVIPEPIDGYVGKRVLTMTYVEGTPVDDGTALRAQGHDLELLVRSAARAWIEGALVHGRFHGDMHAGNLAVTPDGRVAFLDFGITGRLDERTRRVLRRSLPAVLVDGDFEAVARGIFALGAVTEPVDLGRASADVRDLLLPLTRQAIGDISYGAVLTQTLKVATRYKVVMPRELVLVSKQLLFLERYVKELTPGYRMLADPFIVERVVEPLLDVKPPVLTARPATRPLERPGGGLVVPHVAEAQLSWVYDEPRQELKRLYGKAKTSMWNATTDIDWHIDVDPLDTGGLASMVPVAMTSAWERFSAHEKAVAAHHFNAWITSQFLHGEQGALLATSKLVQQVPWVEAKEYGAAQVMDEARHVEVYSRYLREKLELEYPVNDNLRQLLEIVIADPRWDVTYLGMQIVVEGIALAAFGIVHQLSTEPLIRQITRQVMADEARHVAFGALSLAGVYDDMTDAELRDREDFVVEAAWLMRDRFLATDVWERLGIPLDDGLLESASAPMLQLFQRVLFAKITPNLRKIGLLSERLAGRLISIGAMAPSDL